jgi:outer membrane protein
MNKWIAAAAMTLAVPVASAKVLISIDAGAGYSMNSISDTSGFGDVAVLTGTSDSSPYGLGMEADPAFYGWAKVSIPLLPDVKVKYETMNLAGSNDVTVSVPVGPESIDLSGDVDSQLDLSHLDLALTIGLPLPVVDIDFGINARSMIGGYVVEGEIGNATNQKEEVSFTFPGTETPLIIPMGYLSVGATVPGVGVKLSGEISTLPLGAANITDWNVKGTWYAPLPTNLLMKVGLEGGYRSFSMTLDTDDFDADVSVSGVFVGAAMHF